MWGHSLKLIRVEWFGGLAISHNSTASHVGIEAAAASSCLQTDWPFVCTKWNLSGAKKAGVWDPALEPLFNSAVKCAFLDKGIQYKMGFLMSCLESETNVWEWCSLTEFTFI